MIEARSLEGETANTYYALETPNPHVCRVSIAFSCGGTTFRFAFGAAARSGLGDPKD